MGGTTGSNGAFGLFDLNEVGDEDFGRTVSSSDVLSSVLCLCMEIAGEFGRLLALRADSSEVRDTLLVKFADSLGARLRVELSDAPVSRRPLGFAEVW